MKMISKALLFVWNTVAVLFFAFLLVLSMAEKGHAGILDSITTIVGGHIDDIKSRSTADQTIGSLDDVYFEGQIRENDEGQDFLHNASGTVQIRYVDGRFYVQLDSDFTSTPGPDYHVYASKTAGIKDESDFNASTQVEIGKLIKGKGASYYELKGIEADEVKSITIWCKAFGEFIGSADLS